VETIEIRDLSLLHFIKNCIWVIDSKFLSTCFISKIRLDASKKYKRLGSLLERLTYYTDVLSSKMFLRSISSLSKVVTVSKRSNSVFISFGIRKEIFGKTWEHLAWLAINISKMISTKIVNNARNFSMMNA
jgi:hypothetical protein